MTKENTIMCKCPNSFLSQIVGTEKVQLHVFTECLIDFYEK